MGVCLCETHGRQPLKNVCPHVAPGGRGTTITMIGGHARVLACDACVATYAVQGDVPDRLEEAFSAIVRS